ncbi:MAG: hypothetical protein HYW23_01060 [Candidatus Aenigmarchaeota archaeon]|nr:hypothetical protein [Candidatus Aenigmarchaeota archaeon]
MSESRERYFLPRALIESGLAPVFDRHDIEYRKAISGGKLAYVMILDGLEGVGSIFRPTQFS